MQSKPWEQQKAISDVAVKKIIEANLPLSVKQILPLGSGWDNHTWLINQTWAFRFPKHKEAAQLLLNEIKILPHLPPLAVKTPKPELICLEPIGFSYPFYGHPYLLGTPADQANLSDADRMSLADTLGVFLKQLHAFPLAKAQELGVGCDQIQRADIKKRYALTKTRMEYLVQQGLVNNAQIFMEAFLPYMNLAVPNEFVLGQGDLYARHILLDNNKKLSAIIDWGDCELLSPAVDLRIAYQFLPPEAQNHFWNAYGMTDELTKIVAKLCAIYSAVTLVWYAHQVKDEFLLQEGLLGLRYISQQL
jgi:aminoglycoside phosphotransferase (APT) family kinase protein